MSAEETVERAVHDLPAVGLDRMNQRAALMTRTDRKYFIDADRCARLLGDLTPDLAVLEIDGARLMRYRSTYFDTEDLWTYRAHLQGRRRRYKVRLRTYVDTGAHFLEVKHKGHRAVTEKSRVQYVGRLAAHHPPVLGGPGHRYVSTVVHDAYGLGLPGHLRATVTTANRRATLLLPDASRMTVDVDLRLIDRRGSAGTAVLRPGFAMVETKSIGGMSAADQALRALGVRPVKISKYCAAVGLHRPDLPSNPWCRVLRTYFELPCTDRCRASAAVTGRVRGSS